MTGDTTKSYFRPTAIELPVRCADWTSRLAAGFLVCRMGREVLTDAAEAFIGRAPEMGEIVGVLRRTARGAGGTILLSGDAGVGKTRLTEEAGYKAAGLGMDVLWGRSSLQQGTPPFWPWIQVFRGLALCRAEEELASYPGASELRHIMSEFDESSALAPVLPSERVLFGLLDRITTFLLTAARTRPLMTVLDDLQWADHGTVELAKFLAGQTKSAPITLILIVRDTDIDNGLIGIEPLGELPTDAVRLKLEGLDEVSTSKIVTNVTGVKPPRDVMSAIHRQTGGNPLFVRELSKLLVSQDRLQQLRSGRSVPVPPAVRDVLEKRFARLSQGASEILRAASVLGTAFDVRVLQVVGGVPLEELDELIGEARLARIVLPDESMGRYRFAHALMRETLYAGLTPAVRRAYHLSAAGTLESSGAHPAEIAHHLIAAFPDSPLDKVVSFAEQAGKRALAAFAYREAASLFQRALDLLPLDEVSLQRGRLVLMLADAEVRLGERPQAAAHYRTVFDLARMVGDAELMGRAALGLAGGPSGFEVQAVAGDESQVLDEALIALAGKDSSLRVWLAAHLSVALTFTDQQERRHKLAREAVELARRLGDPAAHAYALSAYCDTIAGPDHVQERMGLADQMIDKALAADDPELELLARRFRLVTLAELGRFDQFDRELSRFQRVSDDLNQPVSAWYVPLWRAMRAHMLGHYQDCESLLADAERIGVAQAHSDNAYMLVFSLKWPLLYELGRVVETEETVLDVDRNYGAVPAAAVMVGLNHLWMGRRAEAEAALERLTETGLTSFPKDAIWLATLALFILLSRGLNDARLTPELADELSPYADLHALDGIAGVYFGSVHHWLGIVALMRGKEDEAEAHLENALKAHARSGAVVWLAHTRRELGELLVSRPDAEARKRGQDLLSKAEQTYRELGLKEAVTGADSPRQVAESATVNTFRKKGDFWEVSYGGRGALLKDTKGLQDLVRLLANPGVEFHVVDLLGAPHQGSPSDEVLDRRARDELVRHAAELKEEIEEATAAEDPQRAALLREELEFVAKELSSAYGLGGRRRLSSDPAERARKTVTSRIRDALSRIDGEHPALGRHLHNALRTGLFCSYQPEDEIEWELS